MSDKIQCGDCGAFVRSLPAHRILTKKLGKPCPGTRKLRSVEHLKPIVVQAVEFTLDKSYGSKCLKSFQWWLDEDAFDEDFEGFDYSYDTICGMTYELLEQIEDYKCEENCTWCSD